jgi:pSer/pThr/pTyr-binding forkhead associated (FHA) protein
MRRGTDSLSVGQRLYVDFWAHRTMRRMVRELIVIGQTAPPCRHLLTEDVITIGRSSTNTLSFPDEVSISRQHTLIQRCKC